MKKSLLIIKREYLSRVKKKSFIIMTIAGPVLTTAFIILTVYLGLKDKDIQNIGVVDETTLFIDALPKSENIKFEYLNNNIDQAKLIFYKTNYTALLYIPENTINVPLSIQLYYKKQPGFTTVQYLKSIIKNRLEEVRLKASYGLNTKQLKAIKADNVHISTIKIEKTGKEEERSTSISMVMAYIASFLIYIFIFMYGVQVMRGVIEEKSNRIIEIIISSVKPFQLMLGKIIGIAFVGLTQFILWIVLTFSFLMIGKQFFKKEIANIENNKANIEAFVPTTPAKKIKNSQQTMLIKEITTIIKMINFPVIIFTFIFYFLGGYFLYGALFAAVGSAVDSEADTQQFMFPITIPLLFAIVMSQFVMNNPDGQLAFWLSVIPLTSPVLMMVRIPFGVPIWQVIMSMTLLLLTFIIITYLSGKIYRIGILMYGKKASYKDLLKWLKV